MTDIELARLWAAARNGNDTLTALRLIITAANGVFGRPVCVDAVVTEIAARSGARPEDLIANEGRTGPNWLTKWRSRAWWLLHFRFDQLSFPQLGAIFDGRHHSTIVKAVQRFNDDWRASEVVRAEMEGIEGAVAGRQAMRANAGGAP